MGNGSSTTTMTTTTMSNGPVPFTTTMGSLSPPTNSKAYTLYNGGHRLNGNPAALKSASNPSKNTFRLDNNHPFNNTARQNSYFYLQQQEQGQPQHYSINTQAPPEIQQLMQQDLPCLPSGEGGSSYMTLRLPRIRLPTLFLGFFAVLLFLYGFGATVYLYAEVKTEKHMMVNLAGTMEKLEQNYEEAPPALREAIEQVERLKTRVNSYEKIMSDMSAKALAKKFGPGPFRVEMFLEFNHASSLVVFDLAPASLMPHSIHLFLEQVSRGLFDGCSIHHNLGHLLWIGPDEEKGTSIQLQHFKRSLYEHVAFQEYSPEYPHKQYTIGYSGRPGGPDFYINTIDNTQNHGPHSGRYLEEPHEADPCFGKVVEGFDVLDMISKLPTRFRGEGDGFLKKHIKISSMRIQGFKAPAPTPTIIHAKPKVTKGKRLRKRAITAKIHPLGVDPHAQTIEEQEAQQLKLIEQQDLEDRKKKQQQQEQQQQQQQPQQQKQQQQQQPEQQQPHHEQPQHEQQQHEEHGVKRVALKHKHDAKKKHRIIHRDKSKLLKHNHHEQQQAAAAPPANDNNNEKSVGNEQEKPVPLEQVKTQEEQVLGANVTSSTQR